MYPSIHPLINSSTRSLARFPCIARSDLALSLPSLVTLQESLTYRAENFTVGWRIATSEAFSGELCDTSGQEEMHKGELSESDGDDDDDDDDDDDSDDDDDDDNDNDDDDDPSGQKPSGLPKNPAEDLALKSLKSGEDGE